MSADTTTNHGGLPFPKRWLYLIALKIVALAAIIYLVLHWNGLL